MGLFRHHKATLQTNTYGYKHEKIDFPYTHYGCASTNTALCHMQTKETLCKMILKLLSFSTSTREHYTISPLPPDHNHHTADEAAKEKY